MRHSSFEKNSLFAKRVCACQTMGKRRKRQDDLWDVQISDTSTTTKQSARKRRPKRTRRLLTPRRVLWWSVSWVLLCWDAAQADWIDPDTPMNKRTTMPLANNPHLKRPPPQKKENNNKKKKTSQTKSPSTTAAPSNAPSADTQAPSTQPSPLPSAFPSETPPLRPFELVFSDEFNVHERSFADGHDPRWTALEKNDYTNDALHYYAADAARTVNGHLVITSTANQTAVIGYDDQKRKHTHVTKYFRSAMVQSWSKFCFSGGIIEASVILPGRSKVGGLWPAFWLLGNLARHTYMGSAQHIWPWSATHCPSQQRPGQQRFSACAKAVHYGLEAGIGRGAPEMDIFEVQPGNIGPNQGPFLEMPVGQPFMSSSYQVAPGRSTYRPGDGYWPGPKQWYQGIRAGQNASLNIQFYGNYNHYRKEANSKDYWSDAISMNRQLNEDYFRRPHTYRVEWDLPSNTTEGYVHWFLDGDLVFSLSGEGLKEAGYGAEISSEPSYILMNTAISTQWGFPLQCPANCPCKVYNCRSTRWQEKCGFSEGFCDMMTAEKPPEYKIDWVRVYQNPDDEKQKVGCSTPERPTRRFIEAHEDLYKTENDLHPLRGVQRGRGRCQPKAENSCGGPEHGTCTAGRVCECRLGWTGPHCLAHQGYDPIMYDQPDRIIDVGFVPPKILPTFLLFGFFVLAVLLVGALLSNHRLSKWTPIPDVDSKFH